MRWFKIAFIFLVFLLSSCRNEPSYPKPKSYLRIDLPEKEYYKIENYTCPFSFEIPNYATWKQRFKNNKQRGFKIAGVESSHHSKDDIKNNVHSPSVTNHHLDIRRLRSSWTLSRNAKERKTLERYLRTHRNV